MSGPWELYQKQQPEFAPTPTGQAVTPDPQTQKFFHGIAEAETGGTKNPYQALNPNSSATGKYQFLWNQWGDAIGKFAGRPVTQQEFMNSPELQENWAKHYYRGVLEPEARQLLKEHKEYLKDQGVNNLKEAKVLIHFLGYPGAKEFAKTGQMPAAAKGVNKSVTDYLNQVRSKWKEFDSTKAYKVIVGGGTFSIPANQIDRLLKDRPDAKIVSDI